MPSPPVEPPSSPSSGVVLAVAVPLAYVAWLGWHTLEQASAYPEWRVVGLALTWSALVIVGAWRGSPTTSGVTATAALVLVWCADAATTPHDDANLWPIGAVALLLGAGPAAIVLAGLTAAVRALSRRRRSVGQ